jgi:type II secretory pathway component GspD/PulD (secretin)
MSFRVHKPYRRLMSSLAIALAYSLAFNPVAALAQARAAQQAPAGSAAPSSQQQNAATANAPLMQATAAPPRKQDVKKAKEAQKRAAKAAEAGDWQTAYEEYDDAVHFDPSNFQYVQGYAAARAHVVQDKMDAAERDAISGQIAAAVRLLRQAREIDPTNKVLAERLTELAALDPTLVRHVSSEPQLAKQVLLEHLPGTQTFTLRGETQGAYEEIARRFGVEVAFDVDVRQRPVRLDLQNVDFATVTRVLGEATGTFWRPLTKTLFFVAPDTAQKRKDYDVSIVRTVVFSASETADQITEISRLVREIAGVTRTDLDSKTRSLTMRASPQAMAVATGLIDDLEKPVGELVLEVMIVEMDRTKQTGIGVLGPQTAQIYSIPSNAVQEAQMGAEGLIAVLTEIFGQPTSLSGLTASQIAALLASGQLASSVLIPPLFAFGGGKTTFIGTLPGATAQLSETLSNVHSGRRILLRAEDGQPATFFVGERYPVSLAQYSASLGSSTGVNIPGVGASNFPVTTLATGTNPDFVTTADFNADGFQDMAIANYTDGTVSVFLGVGDGTFQTPTTVTVGTGPASIATGIFNATTNDNLDMVVANQTTNNLTVLLGNGDGTFAAGTSIITGNQPVSVIATDLNGDGTPDLVVANKADNTIEVFLGKGDGTFTPLTPFPSGAAPTCLLADDFNGDGKIDLAVTNSDDNTMEIFLGNGDGTFGKGVTYATGVTPLFVAPGDFNGDGIIDLAVADSGAPTAANSVGNAVSIFLGNGDGTFGTAALPREDFAAGTNPTSIAVADYNVDGRPDLAVTAQGDNSVALLLGIGDGTFSSFVELALGTAPDSCASADFNGDGIPDLAVTNNQSNDVSIILNSSSFIGNVASTGTQFPNAEYIDIGLKVKATPRIHEDKEVTLQFELTLSSLAGSSLNNIPVVNNEELHQTVRVNIGQTARIAEYIAPQRNTNLNGTPGLASLPYNGFGLGGLTTANNTDTELLILVTPRLVALNPRKDHVIYAGRGALEGAGSFGFTQQERRNAPEVPAPAQPAPAATQEAPQQPAPQQERPLPSPGAQPSNPPPATNPPPANPLEGNPQQANPQQPPQPQ